MKTSAIIAELNPLHNGHKYIFDYAKKELGADFLVIIMSGSFVQRGEPACMYKYDRVLSALKSGADLVLELPVSYATASAEAFAYGAVSIAAQTGIADMLVFGAEDDDTDRLYELAKKLSSPDDDLKESINALVRSGLSYPAARAAALTGYEDILAKPNNILAIEYLKSLIMLGTDIHPYALLRKGADYNDKSTGNMCSALSIREHINAEGDITDISSGMPDHAFDILNASYGKTCPICAEDLRPFLDHALLTSDPEDLYGIQDMNPDLANRFVNTYKMLTDRAYKNDMPFTISDYLKEMRTKEITYSRLSRALIHVILGLDDLTRDPAGNLIKCPYTRILGFRKEASDLMHRLSSGSNIPVITKPGDAKDQLNEQAYKVFEETVRSDRICDSLIKQRYGTLLNDTCRISPVIV